MRSVSSDRSGKRAHVALRTWALVIGVSLVWPRLTSAQDVAEAVVEARLDVHRQANGRLVVIATNTPLDDVIREVAKAADVHVMSIGAMPRSRVTVLFSDRAPEIILRELMAPAGISYVLVSGGSGGPGRLVMGLLSPRVDPGSGVLSATAALVTPLRSTSDPADVASDVPRAQEEPARSGPTEWPTDVPPVNAGATIVVPDSVEALFQMVNGSVPVSLPSSVTPNANGARTIGIESVNAFKRGVPFTSRETAPRPGAVSSLGAATPFPAILPAIDPSMLRPPRTIQIPAPVVIQFPAPTR